MLRFATRSLAMARVRRMDPEQVASIQQRRLRALLVHATTRIPYFRELYQGIDVARAPLRELPATSKGELMAHFDQTIADPDVKRAELERFLDDPENVGKLFLDRYVPSHTSGSQGQPMLMLQEPRSLELMFGLQMTRGKVGQVSLVEAVRRLRRPARLAIVTLKRGFYPSASTFEYMPKVARRFVEVLRLSQTDDDVVERLNAFRPTVLTAYAGVLDMLAPEALAGRLRLAPGLQQVVNNSEVLTDQARARIEDAFGVHILNNYATGECTMLTNGCATGTGAHVNADWAILEVVDEFNRPVPDGRPGKKVLITNLSNHLQPFIRYEVGDVVTMATTPCDCGSRLPRVAHIDGRSADTFWVRDGLRFRQVINSVFKNAFDYTREVREWQAVQVERNRVVIDLELVPGASFDERHAILALDRQLEMYGLLDLLKVRLQVVPRLSADPRTGKFRRMVSLVGPPADAEAGSAALRVDHAEPSRGPHSLKGSNGAESGRSGEVQAIPGATE